LSITRLGVALLRNGLLLAALAVTAALSAAVTMRAVLSAQEVIVPNVVGQRLASAGALVVHDGLKLRVEGKRHDALVPRGQIATQDPPAGSALKPNRSVRVWLSLGPRRLEVPPVEGESLRTARLTFNQARVPLGRVIEVSSTRPEGTVLLQRPPPGEMGDVGEGVSLLISRGPGGLDYLMPDLIGQRGDPVLRWLAGAGWKTSVRYRSYPGVAPGIVLRQTPSSGHRMSRRDPIGLEISQQ